MSIQLAVEKEFSVAEAFGYDGAVGGLIPTADMKGLRLYAVQKNASSTPVENVIDRQYGQGWVRSTPETACGAEYWNDGYSPSNTSAYCAPHCGPSAVVNSYKRKTWGYFSAVCWATGAALLRDTGRPQGLLASNWGGTRIESVKRPATFLSILADSQTHGKLRGFSVDAQHDYDCPRRRRRRGK